MRQACLSVTPHLAYLLPERRTQQHKRTRWYTGHFLLPRSTVRQDKAARSADADEDWQEEGASGSSASAPGDGASLVRSGRMSASAKRLDAGTIKVSAFVEEPVEKYSLPNEKEMAEVRSLNEIRNLLDRYKRVCKAARHAPARFSCYCCRPCSRAAGGRASSSAAHRDTYAQRQNRDCSILPGRKQLQPRPDPQSVRAA